MHGFTFQNDNKLLRKLYLWTLQYFVSPSSQILLSMQDEKGKEAVPIVIQDTMLVCHVQDIYLVWNKKLKKNAVRLADITRFERAPIFQRQLAH